VQNYKDQVTDPLIVEIKKSAKNPYGIQREQILTSPGENKVGEMSTVTANSAKRNCVCEYSRDILRKGRGWEKAI